MKLSTTTTAVDHDNRHDQPQTPPTTKETAGWIEARKEGFRRGVAGISSAVVVESKRLPVVLLGAFCLATIFALSMMLSVGADVALAQDGSQIEGAITKFRNWLAGLIVGLGGIALLIAVMIFLFSGSESRRRAEAARYIGAICVAIFVGLSIPAIIGAIQSFAS